MSAGTPTRATRHGLRRVTDWLLAGLLVAIISGLMMLLLVNEDQRVSKAKPGEQEAKSESAFGIEEDEENAHGTGRVLDSVVNAMAPKSVSVPLAPPGGGFTPQTRLGFTNGDQWEPAIAADRSGHVYVLYAQYFGVPGCPACASPTNVLQVSNDGGATWGAPHPILAQSTGQWDSQIVVDPVDGSTVYATWMQNNKADMVVAKSTDFGANWAIVVADGINAGGDKPILVVKGQDLYMAYNHSQTIWISRSHDGGQTWAHWDSQVNGSGWSLPSQGAIAPDGTVYFSWNGYKKSGNTTGDVTLYLTKSTDGGATWSVINVDVSKAPPDCSAYSCGWGYLGAVLMVSVDSNGTVYALEQLGTTVKGPERIYFRKSTDGGATWSARTEVSTAPNGKDHAFPAMWAGGNGNVSIGWMDNRNTASDGTPAWNVWYRTSTNGGGSWSAETRLSTYVSGYTYIFPEGFRYPFGDYWEMDMDGAGNMHLVWGEGFSYDSPGSIWYVTGR